MKNAITYILTLLVLLTVQSSCSAGLFASRMLVSNNCAPIFQSQIQRVISHSANFVQHSQAVFPTVNYFVGAPIRLQALVKQELQADPLYNEFQEFKRFQQYQQQRQLSPLQSTTRQLDQPISLVEKNCAKCHSGPSPKGEFSIDGQFTAIERDIAARMVILGKMPKSIELSPADKGDIIKEILLLGVEE